MKIQIDTDNKIIKLLGDITIGELVENLLLLANTNWRTYTIIVNGVDNTNHIPYDCYVTNIGGVSFHKSGETGFYDILENKGL